MENKMTEYRKIIVHAGPFHADDVTCVALARTACPDIEVERQYRISPEDAESLDVIVADIGGGRFDHHQVAARTREDGSRYAACGLVFEELRRQIFPDKTSADLFEKQFIIPIEAADNGIRENPLSIAISDMNPTWDSGEDTDQAFMHAVSFMQDVIRREVRKACSMEGAGIIVEEALQKSADGIVILPVTVPWKSVLVPSDAYFVIYPSDRGGVNLQAIPQGGTPYVSKRDLPEEWLTQPPDGCSFVHIGRFLASFEDVDSAVSAARAILSV